MGEAGRGPVAGECRARLGRDRRAPTGLAPRCRSAAACVVDTSATRTAGDADLARARVLLPAAQTATSEAGACRSLRADGSVLVSVAEGAGALAAVPADARSSPFGRGVRLRDVGLRPGSRPALRLRGGACRAGRPQRLALAKALLSG